MNAPDDTTTTTHTTARFGFFPFVTGDRVEVRQAGVTAALAGGDLDLTQGGTQLSLVGGSASIVQGGAQMLVAGGDVTITQGGAGVLFSRSVHVDQGIVGIVLAPRAVLEGSTVVFSPGAAAALGGAIALGIGVVGLLAARFRRS